MEQGKVSMSRSVVAEMTGAKDLPEEARWWVPVFAEAAVNETEFVSVVIDPQPEQERFRLLVKPGDIERAYAAAEDSIAKKLADWMGKSEQTIPVYRGKP
jgi:hypothetical protein